MKLFMKNKGGAPKVMPEPVIKSIPIEELNFAPYQREVKMAKVRKIIDFFMPDIVGIALVSYRGGKFWCMDAQHRVEALKRMGYKEVWCSVLTGLTYEEECRRFNILNTGRTQLLPNQVFHCRVEEREVTAIALVEMFKKYKYDYNKNGSVKQNNVIGAVSKFDIMLKKYGMTMVERVLKVLREAWLGEKDSLESSIITGLATFFNEHPNVDDKILIDALGHIAPKELLASASLFMKFGIARPGRADSACYHIAKQINELYEDRLRNPRRFKTPKEKPAPKTTQKRLPKNQRAFLKKEIVRLSKDFNGINTDNEVIRLTNIPVSTYYKYKKELKEVVKA